MKLSAAEFSREAVNLAGRRLHSAAVLGRRPSLGFIAAAPNSIFSFCRRSPFKLRHEEEGLLLFSPVLLCACCAWWLGQTVI